MKMHKRLRILRIRRELKAQDVAAQIGVSNSALSMFERYGVPLPGDAEDRLKWLLGAPAQRADVEGQLHD